MTNIVGWRLATHCSLHRHGFLHLSGRVCLWLGHFDGLHGGDFRLGSGLGRGWLGHCISLKWRKCTHFGVLLCRLILGEVLGGSMTLGGVRERFLVDRHGVSG